MSELKPCPFCGCEKIEIKDHNNFRLSFWCLEPDCECVVDFICSSRPLAIEAWNTRPGETAAFEDGYQQALTNHQIMNENESEKFLKKMESNKKVGPIPTPKLKDAIQAIRKTEVQ